MLHENIKKFMEGFQYDAHPMGILLSTVGALSTIYPDAKRICERRRRAACRSAGSSPRCRRIAACAYRHSIGLPYVYPDNDLSFTGNFLNMLFKMTELEVPAATRCSSARSTCCSSCTPITSRTAARARCAASAARRPIRTRRWRARRRRSTGPLHGGANEAVLRMLKEIGIGRARAGLHQARESAATAA